MAWLKVSPLAEVQEARPSLLGPNRLGDPYLRPPQRPVERLLEAEPLLLHRARQQRFNVGVDDVWGAHFFGTFAQAFASGSLSPGIDFGLNTTSP